MADAVAVAARRVAPKDARRAVRKVVSKARVVPKDVRKVALMVAPKAVAENAASAIRKAAAMPVVRNVRNAPPAKPETTATRTAAPTTALTTVNRANHEPKVAVADATAAMVATVASSTHRVTRSSRTLQRPIGRRWLRLRVVRVRATAHRVSARKATVTHVANAVSAVVAATTAGVNAVSVVNDQTARTPHLTP